MADRYWVGGTGSWTSTSTTNWSATSGGSSGASVPTSADNVFYDANSNVGTGTFTVLINQSNRLCNNFTVSGLDGAMTLAFSLNSFDLTVHGSWTTPATGFSITQTDSSELVFAGTGAKTINTGGAFLGNSIMKVYFNGAGSTWTLASNLLVGSSSSSENIHIVAGTLNTSASNYTISCLNLFSEGTLTRGLILNGSTVNIRADYDALSFSGSNFTFNAGTSNIIFTNTRVDFEGNSLTFYDVTFSNSDFTQLRVYGTNTFRNITFASPTAFKELLVLIFSNNQTITGTLTLNRPGNADIRCLITSSVNGSQRTLTINSTDALSDVDFSDIRVLGTAAPLTGTRLGDRDNNLGITFAASKTVYWNNPTGGAWKTASWALTSGGTASLNNLPLPQDIAIIEDTGLNSGAQIHAYIARAGDDGDDYSATVGTIDASSRTLPWKFRGFDNRRFYIMRDLKLSSALSTPGSTEVFPSIQFQGRNRTQTFITGDNNFSGDDYLEPYFFCDALNSTVDLIGNFNGAPNSEWHLYDGTLRLNGNTLSTGRFAVSEDYTRVKTINFGATGEIVVANQGESTYNYPLDLGPSVYINLTGSRKFRTTAPLYVGLDSYLRLNQTGEANSPNITLASASNTRFIGYASEIPTVNNVDFTGFTGTYETIETVRCFGDWNWGSNVRVLRPISATDTIDFVSTSGTKSITSGGTIANVNMRFAGAGGTWQLQSPLTCGRSTSSSNVTITLTDGALDLNNHTLTAGAFTSSVANTRSLAFGSSGKMVLTNNTATIFTTSTATGLTVTGTNPLIEISSNATTGTRSVTMGAAGEANAISLNVTSGSDTVILGTTSGSFKNFSAVGFTGTISHNNSIAIYGNFDAGGATSMIGIGDPQFLGASSTKTIQSNGLTFPDNISFSGAGATWILQDALSVASGTTLTSGALNLNNYTLTTTALSTNAINQTAISFGSGNINLSGTGTIFTGSANCTVTGTPQIICTNATATSRTLTAAAVTEANSISFRITGGTGALTLSTSSAFRNLDFTNGTNPTGYAGAATFNTFTVFGNFKASTGMTRTAGTGVTTFAATSGVKTIDTANVTFDGPFTFNGIGGTFQLQSPLTSGTTRTVTLTNGTLDFNNHTMSTGLFSSTNSNIRRMNFGSTGKMVLTGTSGTIFATGTSTNLTVSGNSLVQCTNGGAGTRTINFGTGALSEANSINFDITSGSDIVSLFGTGGAANSVNFTGFTGTIDIPSAKVIYGNWNSGSAIATSATGRLTFAATSGTKSIRTNNLSFNAGATFNGAGGTWLLSDDLSVGTANSIQLDAGHLNTNSQSVYSGTFTSNNSTARTLSLGNTEWYLSSGDVGNVIWNCQTSNNLTINYSSSAAIITLSVAATTFAGGSKSYPELSTNSRDLTISGTNTFEKLAADVSANTTIRFPASVTTTINDPYNNQQFTGYSPTRILTLRSDTPGTQATISKPSTGDTVSFDYLELQDINATSDIEQTIWYAGPNSYSSGNVTGWTFTAGGAMMMFL